MANNKISQDGKSIERFSPGSRIGHGMHAILFVPLFITGCMIAFRGFGNLIGSEALKGVAQFHKALGLCFVVPVIILILLSAKNFFRWIKESFSFGKNDWVFVKTFPLGFFGVHTSYPPQGRFNGGEKINSIIQIFGFIIMIVTGFIMWSETASPAVTGWAAAIHSFCGLCLGAIIMAHAYLGLLNKDSRPSLMGMITGKVPMDFAKAHHPLWVEEVEAEEKANKGKEAV